MEKVVSAKKHHGSEKKIRRPREKMARDRRPQISDPFLQGPYSHGRQNFSKKGTINPLGSKPPRQINCPHYLG